MNKETVNNFEYMTNYNLTLFLVDFSNFFTGSLQSIFDYFKGESVDVPSQELTELNRLYKEGLKIRSLFISYQDSFDNYSYWELVDDIDIIITKIETFLNSSKWLRSSISDSNYTRTSEFDLLLKQNQTIENLSTEIGYSDKDQDWVELAIKNDIIEEDYTSQGGIFLKVTFQNNLSINIISIIDNVQGTNVYGKDIFQKLIFEDDDLKALGPKDTLYQSFKINLELRQGDNPQYPKDGIQSSLIAGSNISSVLYASIFRQLYETFFKDDTFKNLSIQDVKQEIDSIGITVKAQSRLDEVVIERILI